MTNSDEHTGDGDIIECDLRAAMLEQYELYLQAVKSKKDIGLHPDYIIVKKAGLIMGLRRDVLEHIEAGDSYQDMCAFLATMRDDIDAIDKDEFFDGYEVSLGSDGTLFGGKSELAMALSFLLI